MKLTYGQILMADQGAQTIGDGKIPWKAAAKLVRIRRALEGPLKELDAARRAIYKEHGLKVGDRLTPAVREDDQELLEDSVDVEDVSPLKENDLKGKEDAMPEVEGLTNAMVLLGPLMELDD